MSKTFVEDLEETRIPFLRGILIRSLQDAGLEFEEASQIASEIRNELAETALISTVDLNRLVLGQLKSLGKDNIVYRYENRNVPLTIEVEQQCGRVNPFSRLKFRHSLETIGLKSRESEDVVQMLQEHLTNKSIKVIKSRNLAMLIYRYLRQSSKLGPAVAHRWLVWHDFINSGRALIFLHWRYRRLRQEFHGKHAGQSSGNSTYPVHRHAARGHAHHDSGTADAGAAPVVLYCLERVTRSSFRQRTRSPRRYWCRVTEVRRICCRWPSRPC